VLPEIGQNRIDRRRREEQGVSVGG
jgi:hypothetical protein